MTVRALLLWSAALGPALGACESERLRPSSHGDVEVSAPTSGSDPDGDGYSVTLDGGGARFLALGGSITFSDVAAGTHELQLSGIAPNCGVAGANPRAVTVSGGEVARVSFEVRCGVAETGAFLIAVTTTGDDLDPDGYLLAVAASPVQRVATNDVALFADLTPGAHLVTLKDVADNCALAGENPQPFTVVAGKTLRISLAVQCAARTS
jgi:hypothetical protein